jgi:alpha-tubulin suppressor-like RCC1 family protein
MSFGGDCLIKRIDERILGIEGSTYKSAQLSGAIDAVKTSFCCVPTVNDLPAASCNEGRFIYVEDIKSFRYSDGYFWTKDACTVLGNVNTNAGLWTWGCNNNGQLGNGTVTDRCSPGTVWGSNFLWCKVSNGFFHTLAIKTDGTLWTWGCNSQGQLGDGTTVNRCSPGTVAGGGTNWCQFSGYNSSAAIKTDGTLWTWGTNACGQLGDGTAVSRCSPGTVAGGGTTWCQVSSGSCTNLAIKTDGTLWTWGSNTCGKLGDGTTVSRCSPGTIAGEGTTWCQVFSGFSHTSAIKTDGTLWTWGCGGLGILGDGTTVSRCSPGTVAGGGTTWCQVSAPLNHSTAIKCDGTLWAWGSNSAGIVDSLRCSPETILGGGTTWCQVSASRYHNVAIKTDGTLWTWGCGSSGRLGDGTTVNRSSPGTILGGGTAWFQVSDKGVHHTTALKSRGF